MSLNSANVMFGHSDEDVYVFQNVYVEKQRTAESPFVYQLKY